MCSLTKGIFIVGAKRTPFGTLGGKLASKSLTDLSEIASKAALQAANVNPELVDSVVIGNVRSASSSDGFYLPRHVLLRCGIPVDRPAFAVNRMCGSGFQAIISGAQEILMGHARIVLTGGSEVMSAAPFLIRNSRFGTRLGVPMKVDDALWQGFTDPGCNTIMGMTAENLAVKYKITREEADQFGLDSQQKWATALADGRFAPEITPVQTTVKGKPVEMVEDEHPRPATTLEGLKKLRPVFKPEGGIVTAGNASGINDGAGSVVIASEEACTQQGLKPLARFVGYSIVGVEPTIMGIGPVTAIQNLLKLAGMTMDQIDLVEINEAFAPQVIACNRELRIDPSKLNVNGGAIAVGHPVGASGARITGHLAYELKRRGLRYGIGSACIGGGQGIAVLVENV